MKTRILTAIALSVMLATIARAADNNWTDGNGKWEIGANWSLGVPTTNTQSGISIINAGNNTVTIDATTVLSNGLNGCMTISNLTLTANTLQLTNAALATPLRILNGFGVGSGGALIVSNSAVRVDGEFDIDGTVMLKSGSISVTNPFPSSLHIGHVGFGQMTVSNGILQASVEFVGYAGGSSGTLTLAGGTNLVGNGGLNVSGFDNSAGVVWITGGSLLLTNQTDFNVGSTGSGSLVLSNGTVQAGHVVVGFNPGSVGAVTVSGGSMIFTNASNTGSMDVRNGVFTMNGGAVAVDQLFMTNGSAGAINFNGGVLTSGSTTVSNGSSYFFVGNGSVGASLNLVRGNHLFYDPLDVGDTPGSTGSVWMSANQLTTANGSSLIGVRGVGQMTISNGTWLASSVHVGVSFGLLPGSQGTFTVAGGNTFIAGLAVGSFATGAVWITGGQLTVTNSTIGSGSNGGGIGRLTMSNGTYRSSVMILGQTVDSTGTVVIAGGNVIATNASNTGSIDVRRGAFTMTGGSVAVDQLFVTNGAAGVFNLNGGVLTPGSTTVSNGIAIPFVVGSGSTPATLNLFHGNHSFFDNVDIGDGPGSTGSVWITGGQLSATTASRSLQVGGLGATGRMIISNGTVRVSNLGVGGNGSSAGTLTMAGGTNVVSALIIVGGSSSGTGAVWIANGELDNTNTVAKTSIGLSGSGQMTVSNGTVRMRNLVVASGNGGDGTLKIIGGIETVSSSLIIGDCGTAAEGFVYVKGGDLFVTNTAHNAVLDVRNGWVLLTAGQLEVDKIVMTNDCGLFINAGGNLIVGSTLLDPNLDADGDGLPNGWEQAHGLNPLSGIGNDGADGDPDGDGLTNMEELDLGTDPSDPSSPYRITSIVRQGNNIRVSWETVGGKINVMQATARIVGSFSSSFSDLSPQIVAPGVSVSSTNYLDVGGATNKPSRFYRVRIVK